MLLNTDSRYFKDMGVTLLTLATPGDPHRYTTPRSALPVSALAHSRDLRRGPSHQSTCSNVETRMDRPKSVVRVVREVSNISCFLCYKTVTPKLSGSVEVLFLSTRPQFSCFLPTTCLFSQKKLCSVVSNTQPSQFSQFY